MKRILSLLLAAALCVSLLASCGGAAFAESADKLTPVLRNYLEPLADDAPVPVWIDLVQPTKEEIDATVQEKLPPDLTEGQAWYEARSAILREIFDGLTGGFAQAQLDGSCEILYRGKYIAALVVLAPKAQVSALAALPEVSALDLYTEYEDEPMPEDDGAEKLNPELAEYVEPLAADALVPVQFSFAYPDTEEIAALACLNPPPTVSNGNHETEDRQRVRIAMLREIAADFAKQLDGSCELLYQNYSVFAQVPKEELVALAGLNAVSAVYLVTDPDAYRNKTDITDRFEDEIFLARIYELTGKTPGEPIYDVDVASMSQFSLHNLSLHSLRGIECFRRLTDLDVGYCGLTELDLSSLPQLRYLDCYENRELRALDLTGLQSLRGLTCYNCALTELKVASPALLWLFCSDNRLTALDLSGCPGLAELYCSRNRLTSLDISVCPELRILECENNDFPDLSAIVGYRQELVDAGHYPLDPEPSEPVGFEDVKASDWYYEAVYWAAQCGVTNGASNAKFRPKEPCTRAHVVTFLWRAAGCPEPKTKNNPFTDAKENAFYYEAMLWAAENGITTGTGDGKFSPGKGCTRAQIVTFLWRYAGSPEPETECYPFEDVPLGTYYFQPVLWALENGITTGVSGKPCSGSALFAPGDICTRAQTVTFLYRYSDPKSE